MSAPDPDALRQLFDELSAMPANARTPRLEQIQAEDRALHDELTQLLHFHDAPARCLSEAGLDRPITIDDFTVVREIGRGGMGIVYLARQHHPSREVAIKLVRPGAMTADMADRLAREVQLMAVLDHPGIAKVYASATCDIGFGPQPYFAMEYVDGVELTDATQQMTVAMRCELVARVCDAIQHSHERGVVHRDLKPSNILVGEAAEAPPCGRPRLLDFGIARREQPGDHTALTQNGTLLGTLAYMAPEQIGAGIASPATDIYSLGVVLFEALTGQLPIDLHDRTLTESIRLVQEQSPRRLRKLSPELPKDLEVVVDKALTKEPQLRYGSAAELAADLRRVVQNQPIQARPQTTFYQLRRFAARNRALSWVALALVFTMISGTIGMAAFAADANEASGFATDAARRSDQRAYAANIAQASMLRAGNQTETHRILAETDASLRGIEYRILQSRSEPTDRLIPLAGEQRPAADYTYTRDGRAVVVHVDGERDLVLVDLESYRELARRTFPSRPAIVTLAPDGSHVSVALERAENGHLSRLMIWDAGRDQIVFDRRRDEPRGGLRGMGWTSDSRFCITHGHYRGRPVVRVDLKTGDWASFPPNGTFQSIRPHPDNRSFVTGGWRHDLLTGERLERVSNLELLTCMSPDGQWAAGTTKGHHNVYLMRPGSRERRLLTSFADRPANISWSEDGSLLLSSNWTSSAIKVHHVETGQQLHSLQVPADHRIVLHPKGESLLLYTLDGVARIPLTRTAAKLDEDDYVTAVAFHPLDHLVAVCTTSRDVDVWDVDRGVRIARLGRTKYEPWSLAWSEDGTSVYVRDRYRGVWQFGPDGDAAHVAAKTDFAGEDRSIWHDLAPGARLWRSETLGASGELLAAPGPDQQIGLAIRDARSQRFTPDPTMPGNAWMARPDNARVGIGGEVQKRMLRYGPGNRSTAVAISRDDKLIAVGHINGQIAIWNRESNTRLHELEAHTGDVLALEFLPDDRLASGGIDGHLALWNARTGDRLADFRDHQRAIECLSVARDGTRFASASADRTIRLWDTRTVHERANDGRTRERLVANWRTRLGGADDDERRARAVEALGRPGLRLEDRRALHVLIWRK